MGRWNPILLRASDEQRRATRREAREAAKAARVAIDGKVARAADRWNNPNLYGPTLIRLVRLLEKRRAIYKATASALPRRRR